MTPCKNRTPDKFDSLLRIKGEAEHAKQFVRIAAQRIVQRQPALPRPDPPIRAANIRARVEQMGLARMKHQPGDKSASLDIPIAPCVAHLRRG